MSARIPLPKEHGAWAMWIAPYLVVALSYGSLDGKIFLMAVLLFFVFVAQEPILSIMRLRLVRQANRERYSFMLRWLVVYLLIVSTSFTLLVIRYSVWWLFAFGAVAGVVLLLHILLKSERADRKIAGEFLSVLGLTMSAPATYYILKLQLDRTALLLWLLHVLYFASSIFYVKMRVSRFAHKSNSRTLAWQCGGYHLFLTVLIVGLVGLRFVPAFVLLAFAPVLVRATLGIVMPEQKLNLTRIGLAEVGFTTIFVVFLVWGLRMTLP